MPLRLSFPGEFGLFGLHGLDAKCVLLEDLHRFRHGADFVVTGQGRNLVIHLAGGKPLHYACHLRDRMNDADGDADDAGADDEESKARDDPKNQREPVHAVGRIRFGCRVAVVRLFDDVVDQGAVRRIGSGYVLIGVFRGGHVRFRQSRQQHVVHDGPEMLDLAVGLLGEL